MGHIIEIRIKGYCAYDIHYNQGRTLGCANCSMELGLRKVWV